MSKGDLILDYAPILWLHPHEAFLPEDCKVMAERGDLYKNGKKIDKFNHTLDELRSYGKGHYLKLPDIDMRKFKTPKGSGVPGSGPEAVSELARLRYGNNPFSHHTTRLSKPKFYTRIGVVNIKTELPATPQNMPEILLMKPYVGTYTVIQYFFFYIFNDFWNKHVGDWDSTIEVLINKDTNKRYAFYSMHDNFWMTKFHNVNPDLNEWIKKWKRNKDGKKGLESTYLLNNHLFGFVAEGGHGAYPTPGYTMYGAKLPLTDDIIGATDERVIGYTCIVPGGVTEEEIKNVLKTSKPKIDDSNVKILNCGINMSFWEINLGSVMAAYGVKIPKTCEAGMGQRDPQNEISGS